MLEIGAYEAKTKLPELLRKVESMQEEIVITRFGHAIAKIVPISPVDHAVSSTITSIKALRKTIKKGTRKSAIKAMVEEGRKY